MRDELALFYEGEAKMPEIDRLLCKYIWRNYDVIESSCDSYAEQSCGEFWHP
jgi:uncharacterized protein Usg